MAQRNHIFIRVAVVGDADAIGRVHIETWRTAYAGIVPEEHLKSLSIEGRAKRWHENLQETPGRVLVAEAAGRVIGWVSCSASRDEDREGFGEICGLYVDSDFWGQDVGRALVEAAEESLCQQGFEQITLWVLEDNPRARHFYVKMGYEPDGTRQELNIGGKPLWEIRYRKVLSQNG